jgi:hypothetical protein
MNGRRLWLRSLLMMLLSTATTMNTLAQGPLAPLGTPGPIFRTLTEVEPRIPISSIPFFITNSGTYYLTCSLTASTNASGIVIQSDKVTIDLMGFCLSGSNTAFGITSGGYDQLTVQNGRISGWYYAVYANNSDRCTIRNLQIDHCGSGIYVEDYNVIEDCQILGGRNSLSSFYGIYMGYYNSVRRCMIGDNMGTDGFSTYTIFGGSEASVVDCQLFNNQSSDGHPAYGIWVGGNSLVSGCLVRNGHMEGIYVTQGGKIESCVSVDNVTGIKAYSGVLIEHCIASSCASNGIWVDNRCQVIDCDVSSGQFQGIYVNGDGNRIVNNVCATNASSGIFVFSDDNRIEGNHVFGNAYGIYLRYWGEADKAERNLVLRNSTHRNPSANIHHINGNFVAPIDSTGAFTNDSANYSF